MELTHCVRVREEATLLVVHPRANGKTFAGAVGTAPRRVVRIAEEVQHTPWNRRCMSEIKLVFTWTQRHLINIFIPK